MGRAPCCEKMGLKKGPWTPDEDQILINYIRLHGHSNWRALPKLAGLLRCGKSCRLRWTNYLRPDIKRGNFTPEEEETIIKLHEMLGNRWSTIAGKLPGRTDNEIKNVWHTHLKKRLSNPDQSNSGSTEPVRKRARKSKVSGKGEAPKKLQSEHLNCMESQDHNNNNNSDNDNINDDDDSGRPTSQAKIEPVSPQPCVSTSEMSSVTSTSCTSASKNDNRSEDMMGGYFGDFSDINDDFWREVLAIEDTAMSSEEHLPRCDPNISSDHLMTEPVLKFGSEVDGDEMDFFWHNLLMRTSNELPEFSEIAL